MPLIYKLQIGGLFMNKVWYTICYNTNTRSFNVNIDTGLQLVHSDTKQEAENLMSLVTSQWESFYIFSRLYSPFDSVEDARKDYYKEIDRTASAFCRPDAHLWKR